MQDSLKIIELRAQNIKAIKAVRISPTNNRVLLGGRNGQGKTTVLDCILMGLGGPKYAPGMPVRSGQTEGSIELDLGKAGKVELTVERSFDVARGPSLTIRDASGAKIKKTPQEVLDRLYSLVAFRPMRFADDTPEHQAETLRKLVGLDFAELDAKIAELYDERTDVGRDGKTAAGQLSGLSQAPDGTPDDEVSVAELMDRKAQADAKNAAADRVIAAAKAKGDDLAKAQKEVERIKGELAKAEERARQAGSEAVDAEARAVAVERADTATIVEQIKGADAVNRNVRSKKAHAAKSAEVKRLRDRYQELSEQISETEAEKTKKLAAVKWPIDGLGFGSNGITYKGLPFEQCSEGERYRVSIAIGMALNPDLRVMLLDKAYALDDQAMAAVCEMAAEKDYDVWAERMGDGDPGAIIMVDGEVAQPAQAE